MAQKVSVVLVSDLSEEEIPTGGGETVSYGLDGVSYEIDLTTDEAEQFRELFAGHVAVSRRVGGRRQRGAGSAAKTPDGVAAAEVRAWAKANGYEVPDRGRIPADVRDAYVAAH